MKKRSMKKNVKVRKRTKDSRAKKALLLGSIFAAGVLTALAVKKGYVNIPFLEA